MAFAGEAAGVIFSVVGLAVKFLEEGNLKKMQSYSERWSVDCFIPLPDGRRIKGQHIGERHIGVCKKSWKSLYSPRYEVYANGKGEFISPELRYTGMFILGMFCGNGEAVYDFPEYNRIQRYIGEFHNGSRIRRGKMYLRNDESDEYLYFEGSWNNDMPYTGKFFKEDGATLLYKIKYGVDVTLPTAASDDASLSPVHTPPSSPPPQALANQQIPAAQTNSSQKEEQSDKKSMREGVFSSGSQSSLELSNITDTALSSTADANANAHLNASRILYIATESTSESTVRKLVEELELTAMMLELDGRLVTGKHRGPRELAVLEKKVMVPYTLWCCFFCCRKAKNKYYIRPIGEGTFHIDDPTKPIYRGTFLDGHVTIPESFSHKSGGLNKDSSRSSSNSSLANESHSRRLQTTAHALAPASLPVVASFEDNLPSQCPVPDTPTPAPALAPILPPPTAADSDNNAHKIPIQNPTPQLESRTVNVFDITGNIRIIVPEKRMHGSSAKAAKPMPAEMEMSDGRWEKGHHVGPRDRVKKDGNMFLTSLVAHGRGYFTAPSLNFRYEGIFVQNSMQELGRMSEVANVDGRWHVSIKQRGLGEMR